ncbi:hypothetical protein Tco_1526186, partial [Tanacetum coccineum]
YYSVNASHGKVVKKDDQMDVVTAECRNELLFHFSSDFCVLASNKRQFHIPNWEVINESAEWGLRFDEASCPKRK